MTYDKNWEGSWTPQLKKHQNPTTNWALGEMDKVRLMKQQQVSDTQYY